MTILDHAGDANGAELYRLSMLYAFPTFVKKASSETLYPAADAPANIYAHPSKRLYPCHNAASTWMSSLFFLEKSAALTPYDRKLVSRNLDRMALYWGIKPAVDAAVTEKTAMLTTDDKLPDEDFGFVWLGNNGTKNRQCRMKSAMEVKRAAEWLAEHRDALSFQQRNVIAGKILEKAAAYGAGLGEKLDAFIDKQAGYGVCEPSEVVALVQQRVSLAPAGSAGRATLEKLAEALVKTPRFALEPGMLVKLACTLDDVDQQLNLKGKYTEIIRRPDDVIFKVTYKEAQASVDTAVVLTTGKIYDRQQFTKIALSDVQALFGEEIAGNVASGLDVDPEKLAEFAATMPRDDAAQFEMLLDDSGIPPIHQKSAADRHGLRPEAKAALAAAY